MELALQKFITSAAKLIDVTNLDDHNPFIFKLNDGIPGDAAKYAMAASTIEPKTQILPINGVWLCFNPNSRYYNQALKLVGYGPDLHPTHTQDLGRLVLDEPFVNCWILVNKMSEMFDDLNIYANEGAKGPSGPAGATGLQGPKGLKGDDAVLDTAPVIATVIQQYVALRGY